MSKLKKKQFKINGIDCMDCALRIEKEVDKLAGIKTVQVNFMNSLLKVEYEDGTEILSQIHQAVKKAGYEIQKPISRRTDTLYVEGMDCADETRSIEKQLRILPGIIDIKFNLLSGKITVEHQTDLKLIQNALRKIGFESHLVDKTESQSKQRFLKKNKMLILTVISGVLAFGGILSQSLSAPFLLTVILFIGAIVTSGYHIAIKGWKEARNFTLGMNFLMSIAVIGAVIIGELSEGAMVIFLFSIAQLLESFSIERVRRSIASLMELAPNVAVRKVDEELIITPVEEIEIGDRIIIKPGERFPLDGVVISGHSTVNQAPITGESHFIEKIAGDEVYAGSINQHGTLEIDVTKKSKDTRLSRIIHMVEEAQAEKAPTQQFVEKFAKYYTPVVVTCAFLFALVPPLYYGQSFVEWFYKALVLLVISCPCALVISTPVTIISALTNAARQGILIKGGTYLENFTKMKVMAFDKTGTLTYGKPSVHYVIPINGNDEKKVIQIAASIERQSEHSIGEAIVDYAKKINVELITVENFQSLIGKGASAILNGEKYFIGNHRLFEEKGWCVQGVHSELEKIETRLFTAVLVGNEQKIIGIIALSDEVRENARSALQELYNNGVKKLVMLTGDNNITAHAITKKIGIDDFQAELLPEDKVAAIKELKDEYEFIVMVGDGINDAPALAAATMGIAMGASGSDTAMETADITLLNDDLAKLSYLRKLSRKAVKIIKQNVFIAILLKTAFFVLAIPGLATLWMAVFADMGASLIVIFNGLRTLRSAS